MTTAVERLLESTADLLTENAARDAVEAWRVGFAVGALRALVAVMRDDHLQPRDGNGRFIKAPR